MTPILVRDLLMNMLLGLTALVVLVLAQINPVAKNTETTPPTGDIAAMMTWPQGDIDLDLWVDGPGQKVATGYSNKSGLVWSLLRDDLGNAGDSTPLNAETAFARATPAGEYVINAHSYSAPGPVTAHVEVSLNGRLLVSTNIDLRPKQERTVVRFRLDADGKLVAGSENEVFKALRSATK